MMVIKSFTFKKDFRCYKKGKVIPFLAPLTVLVGDQGSGKTSILEAIRYTFGCGQREYPEDEKEYHEDVVDFEIHSKASPDTRFAVMDFEKENIRVFNPGSQVTSAWQLNNIFAKRDSITKSHGEVVNEYLDKIENDTAKSAALIILDEPDSALSIRSCHILGQRLVNLSKNNQVIVSVHSPIVMQYAKHVFSVEHDKYMKPQKFINMHSPEKVQQ